MRMLFNRKKSVFGFTLIELLIGLSIIGVGIIAIISVARGAGDTSKTQIEVKNLKAIQQAVKTTFGPSGTFTGLTDGIALSAGAYPAQMVAGGVVKNSWGETVSVVANAAPGFYDITYTLVKTSSCINLVPQVLNQFTTIKIASTTNLTSVWTSATISAACATAPQNDIIFTGN